MTRPAGAPPAWVLPVLPETTLNGFVAYLLIPEILMYDRSYPAFVLNETVRLLEEAGGDGADLRFDDLATEDVTRHLTDPLRQQWRVGKDDRVIRVACWAAPNPGDTPGMAALETWQA